MNFLCTSDLHGIVPVQMKHIVTERSVDAILYAGDFTPHGWGGEGNSTEEPLEFISNLGVPVYSVFGNIDPDKEYFIDAERKLKNFNFIHLKRVRIDDWYIVGLGDFYMDSYALRKFEDLLKKDPEKTIILSHYPPEGVVDMTDFGSHVGSREIREIVEKYEPPVMICGHIHEAAGVGKIGKTKVANVAMKNVIIEIKSGKPNISLA